MEQEIFSWKGWDQLDVGVFLFVDCAFKKDFGPIKAGQKFETVELSYEKGTLTASSDGDDIVVKFSLVPTP